MANLVADARALTAGQYLHLVIYGSAAIGDGGGGWYVWDAAETAADDGAYFIKPTSVDGGSPGRWVRVWSAQGDVTAYGRDLLDSVDAAAARTTLGLGTMAVEAAADFISVVATPTAGNFPVLTAGGELSNSTYSNASFATAAQGTLAGTALQPADVGTIAAQNANSVAITGGAISGITALPIASGGTGAGTAANAFAALKQVATDTATGVVELATNAEVATGTDTARAVTPAGIAATYQTQAASHAAVTVSGTPNYVTLSGQDLVRGLVNLATHVTGLLSAANIAGLTTATETGTSHANALGDRNVWLRWTSGSAKGYVLSSATNYAAGDVLQGINAGAGGTLTISGSGVALTGVTTFAIGKSYSVRFVSSTAADVIGGA